MQNAQGPSGHIRNPFAQAGIAFVCSVIFMLAGLGMEQSNMADVPMGAWITAGAFSFVFVLFNSMLCLYTTDINRYRLHSMLAYAGLIACSSLFAWLLTGFPNSDMTPLRKVFIMLTICYLLLFSIMATVRWLAHRFQQEEDQMPKYKQ